MTLRPYHESERIKVVPQYFFNATVSSPGFEAIVSSTIKDLDRPITAAGQKSLSLEGMPLQRLHLFTLIGDGLGHGGLGQIPKDDGFINTSTGQDMSRETLNSQKLLLRWHKKLLLHLRIPSQCQDCVRVTSDRSQRFALFLLLLLPLGLDRSQGQDRLETVHRVQVPDINGRSHGANGCKVAFGLGVRIETQPLQSQGKAWQKDVVMDIQISFGVVVD